MNLPTTGALLLVGSNVEAIALEHAKKLLSVENQALLAANTHPDFFWLTPEEGSNSIKVDQVRRLIEWSYAKPQLALQKVAILSPAHLMNTQAANAFLKTLEEPMGTVFMLLSDKPELLMETVRSRCHWIRVRDNGEHYNESLVEELKEQLKRLRKLQTDPLSVSAHLLKHDAKEVLDSLWLVLSAQTVYAANQGKLPRKSRWWAFIQQVVQARKLLAESVSVNAALVVETVLVEYALAATSSEQ